MTSIEPGENGATLVTITTTDGESVTETIPVGPALQLGVGDAVEAGAVITNDPIASSDWRPIEAKSSTLDKTLSV